MALHPAVAAYLESESIDHETLECDPDLADTADFCAAYDIPLDKSANAILVASKKPPGLFALCLLLATTRLDVNGVVRKRLSVRKVSFASADETLAKTDQAIGGVTVFGIPDDVPIWVDSAVVDQDWVIVGAGTRTSKVRVDPKTFRSHDRFEIVDDLANAY